MNTELKPSVPTGARSESSKCGDSEETVVHKPMPQLKRTRVKRLETSAEIARALGVGQPRTNRILRGTVVALGASVIACVLLAAIVWWRLLT